MKLQDKFVFLIVYKMIEFFNIEKLFYFNKQKIGFIVVIDYFFFFKIVLWNCFNILVQKFLKSVYFFI